MNRWKLRFCLVASLMGLAQGALAGADWEKNGCTIAGSDNAPLVIEEFADFECQYCAKGSRLMAQALKEYGGKIKLIFRNKPLGSEAMSAAKAMSAVCLQNPTLAYSFQEELFNNQERLKKEGESFLIEVAEKLGVNTNQMREDMASEQVRFTIEADEKRAEQLNIKGVPGFKIGSEMIFGAQPYEEMKKAIDRQLNH